MPSRRRSSPSMGVTNEAAAEINVALRLNPESDQVNRAAAYLRFRQQRLGEAIRYYEKSMSLMDTDRTRAPCRLPVIQRVEFNRLPFRLARTLLARVEKMLVQDPNNATAHGSGALALGVLGQATAPGKWINRALLMDPDNMNARYNFACSLTLLFNQPDLDAARELLAPVFETLASGFLDHTEADPDLNPLRENPRFQAMVAWRRRVWWRRAPAMRSARQRIAEHPARGKFVTRAPQVSPLYHERPGMGTVYTSVPNPASPKSTSRHLPARGLIPPLRELF